MLLNLGANPRAKGSREIDRPLMEAARYGEAKAMELLKKRARYPKHSLEKAEQLLKKSAEPEKENPTLGNILSYIHGDSDSLLIDAVEKNQPEEIEKILRHVPDEAKASAAAVALRIACADGKPDLVETLLRNGASGNVPEEPLIEAVKARSYRCVELLLRHGTEPEEMISDIQEIAEENKDWQILRVVYEHTSTNELERLKPPPDYGSFPGQSIRDKVLRKREMSKKIKGAFKEDTDLTL